jgi:hypothetical protein
MIWSPLIREDEQPKWAVEELASLSEEKRSLMVSVWKKSGVSKNYALASIQPLTQRNQ